MPSLNYDDNWIPIPDKLTPLNQKAKEYYYYAEYAYEANVYPIAYQDDETNLFYVFTDNMTAKYYTAYGSDSREYTLSKFLNPYYGYRYKLELVVIDAATNKTEMVVAFTNGTHSIYPEANATLKTYPRGHLLVTD